MSSFNADKKREHENAAEKALANNDYAKAFFHTHQAAEFTYNLAEQSCGDLAFAYLEDANELVEIAAQLKAKIISASSVQRSADVESASAGVDNAEQKQWTVSGKSDIRLDDVKGLAEAKEIVRDALINPVNHPDIYEVLKVKPGTGLLLYGPPGTGKTMFAKAIANEMNTTFMHVKLNELKSKYVGEVKQILPKCSKKQGLMKNVSCFWTSVNQCCANAEIKRFAWLSSFWLNLTDLIRIIRTSCLSCWQRTVRG